MIRSKKRLHKPAMPQPAPAIGRHDTIAMHPAKNGFESLGLFEMPGVPNQAFLNLIGVEQQHTRHRPESKMHDVAVFAMQAVAKIQEVGADFSGLTHSEQTGGRAGRQRSIQRETPRGRRIAIGHDRLTETGRVVSYGNDST